MLTRQQQGPGLGSAPRGRGARACGRAPSAWPGGCGMPGGGSGRGRGGCACRRRSARGRRRWRRARRGGR
eukprot:781809-Rhodomonas_salina.1